MANPKELKQVSVYLTEDEAQGISLMSQLLNAKPSEIARQGFVPVPFAEMIDSIREGVKHADCRAADLRSIATNFDWRGFIEDAIVTRLKLEMKGDLKHPLKMQCDQIGTLENVCKLYTAFVNAKHKVPGSEFHDLGGDQGWWVSGPRVDDMFLGIGAGD